jgi:MFS family permease
MAMSPPQEVVQTAEEMICSPLPVKSSFLGLDSALWRLAIVTGVAQLSASIWIWQFAISLESFLLPWQIGVTFAVGSLAALIGYPVSGFMADLVGRKRSLVFSFIPQTAGILLLFLLPVWPLVLISYGLESFGWAFILVISRAMPADRIDTKSSSQSSRQMTMVLLPSFVVDGISPVLAVVLLHYGFNMQFLLLLGAFAAGVGMLLAVAFVEETLPCAPEDLALGEPSRSLRSLGRPFWKFTGAMIGYYIAWGMAIPYLGILSVREWGVSLEVYGISSSVFSLASVTMMYTLSGFAGRRTKMGLVLSLAGNSVVMAAMGLGSQAWLLILLNMVWAAPVMVWIATEVILSVNGVPADMKGRALGFFQLAVSATGFLAAPLGAMVWEYTGSLRFLWVLSGALAVGFTTVVWWALKRVKIRNLKSRQSVEADQALGR